MPTREIRTTLAIDGDKKFAQAMKDAAQEMRVLQTELGAISAEFKETNDAQKYFAQRGDVLKRELAQQEEIVNALNGALKDSVEKYGAASREANGYRIQLNNAQAKMHDLRRASQQADKEMEEFGRDSKKVGRQIADGIGDGVEEAADEMDDMVQSIADSLESLKGMAGVSIAGQVGEFVVNAAQSLSSFVADNVDLNRQIAIAKFNVEQTGQNWDEINALAIRATAVTGDYDAALEAVSHLSQVGFDDVGLFGAAVDAILGVSIRTQNALNFEGLAESFRESIKTKTPAGQYAEAIEAVLGEAAVDEVTKAFEGTKSTEELIEVALGYLTRAGAQTTTRDWMAENAELVEYTQKQLEVTQGWASLAEDATWIVTEFMDLELWAIKELKKMVTNAETVYQDFLTAMNDPEGTILNPEWNRKRNAEAYPEFANALETGQFNTAEGTLNFFLEGLGLKKPQEEQKLEIEMVNEDGSAETITLKAISESASAIEAAEKSVRNLYEMVGTADDWRSRSREDTLAMFEGFDLANEDVLLLKNAVEEWYATRAEEKETNARLAESADALAETAKTDKMSVADLYEMVGTADDWQNRSRADTLAMFEGYDLANTDVQLLKSAVEEWYSIFGDGTETAMENAATTAETGGENFGLSFGNGILKAQPQVMRNLIMMLDGFNNILNQPAGAPGYSVYSGSGGGNPNQTASSRGMAVLEIDGHTAGRLLYGGVSEEGARRTRTMITVG